jgi:hypothetical protein
MREEVEARARFFASLLIKDVAPGIGKQVLRLRACGASLRMTSNQGARS